MPDLATHYLFGEKVLELLPQDLQRMLEAHRAVFNFAVQGPDLLFFRKALGKGLSIKSSLPSYGGQMHREKIKETLDFMKRYTASKQSETEEYEVLCTYFLGFICHYYLDKTVHPYVYFLVDSICRRHPERTETSVHVKIEAELDAILYELFKKEPVTTFAVKEHFAIDCRSKNIIAKLYTELLREVYGAEFEVRSVMKCFDEMYNTSRLLYDKTGIVRAASDVLGHLLPITRDVTGHVKPKQVKMDTANLNGNCWHHVQNPSMRSHKSVLTLFEEAKEAVAPVLVKTAAQLDDGCGVAFDTSLNFAGNAVE